MTNRSLVVKDLPLCERKNRLGETVQVVVRVDVNYNNDKKRYYYSGHLCEIGPQFFSMIFDGRNASSLIIESATRFSAKRLEQLKAICEETTFEHFLAPYKELSCLHSTSTFTG